MIAFWCSHISYQSLCTSPRECTAVRSWHMMKTFFTPLWFCVLHTESALQNFILKSKTFLWADFLSILQLFEYCRGAQFSLEKIFMSVLFSLASRNPTTIAVNTNFRGPRTNQERDVQELLRSFSKPCIYTYPAEVSSSGYEAGD